MQHFFEIFGLPLIACILMMSMLSYLGLHVLKREIIFIDIALAQVAAVGAIAANLIFGVHGDSILCYSCTFLATLAMAAFYAFARRRLLRIPLEATIGVSYAIAAAVALFLVGISSGGHIHLQHMLAGSILWTTWLDVLICSLVYVAVGLCLFLTRKQFTILSDNYANTNSEGGGFFWWDFLFYLLVSIVITVAVKIGGIVLVFSFLIIPATISALFSTQWKTRIKIAWFFGALNTMLGIIFTNHLDFSVGPAIALFLGICIVISATLKRSIGKISSKTTNA